MARVQNPGGCQQDAVLHGNRRFSTATQCDAEGRSDFEREGASCSWQFTFLVTFLRISTPRGYSLKVKQHQSTSLLALYLRNPKMKLPKRFNRAEQHLFAKQTARVQFKRGTAVYQQEAGRRRTLSKGNFKLYWNCLVEAKHVFITSLIYLQKHSC